MNYGELKTELKALAFEEEDTIEEYEETDVIPTAINRAITMISEKVAPIIRTYEISQDGDDEEYNYYDFTSLTNDFLEFAKHPVRIDDGEKYQSFGDYEIEDDETIVIPGDVSGTFKIFYRAEHTPYVAGGSMDSVDLPLKRKVHYLVPLLAAYYVWLDDDATKAAQYKNEYDQEYVDYLQKQSRPRARFAEGGI